MNNWKWIEIEKKFLVKREKLPKNLRFYKHEEIEQWYLLITQDKEERIRCKWNKYFHTIKTWLWLVRWEIESQISKKEFDFLWQKAQYWKLKKIRYYIPYQKHVIELDIYRWNLYWLIVAEIEFNNIKECNNFYYPKRFWKDVTDDIEFKNRNFALMTSG